VNYLQIFPIRMPDKTVYINSNFSVHRNDKLVILAFISLNLFLWISIVEGRFGIPSVVKYLLSVFALGVLINDRINNPNKEIHGNLYYAIALFFSLWTMYLLISAMFQFHDTFAIQRVLGQRYFFLPYVLPIIIFFTRYDIVFFSYLFGIAYKLIGVAIFFQLTIVLLGISPENWLEQTHRIGIFNLGSGFVLLLSHIIKRKRVSNIIILFYLLMIVLYSFYGRRGALIDHVLFLVFMVIMRLRSPFLRSDNKKKIYLYVFLIIFLVILAFGKLSQSVYVFQRGFDVESLEDSRSIVFEDFFSDFSGATDWVFGRGIDGTVLRTISENGHENFIEMGYLCMVLRGGLLYVVPMIVLLIWSSILGFFKSRNDLTKALAIIIFIQIMSMMSFGLPDFSVQYAFIWIAVTACFSPELRNLSNEDVYIYLNSYI